MPHNETIDSELRLVAALRRAARERGGPLPSIDVADALLDERRELTQWATTRRASLLHRYRTWLATIGCAMFCRRDICIT
jgi:hypothetical protein